MSNLMVIYNIKLNMCVTQFVCVVCTCRVIQGKAVVDDVIMSQAKRVETKGSNAEIPDKKCPQQTSSHRTHSWSLTRPETLDCYNNFVILML